MLQSPKSFLDVSRLNRSPAFVRWIEETSFSLAFSSLILPSTLLLNQIFSFLNLKCLLSQSLNDLKCQKPEDINNIIIRFTIRHNAKACPLAETFTLAKCE